ncbi:MAG: inorganic phosphate transporter [Cyanobacteria bacterium P01_A01_bin.84]
MLDNLFLVALLGFYIAWNLGANDVANSMGTSVGSKAVTLKQALIIAGILEFSGALLFGHQVSSRLATKIANPLLFADAPYILATGMVAVLLACGLWLQIATSQGLPVSSSHAVVGAIAGFSWVAVGVNAIEWESIGEITLGWILTPVISGLIAALFYTQVKNWILSQPQPLVHLNEWIPWLSVFMLAVFGVIVFPSLTPGISTFVAENTGIKIPEHDFPLLFGGVGAIGLTFYNWRGLEKTFTEHTIAVQNSQNLEENVVEKLVEKLVEKIFSRFQILSACFVAFAHGANDVGNAIAPVVAINYIKQTGEVPMGEVNIPLWIFIIGGLGIITGLAIWGKKVIATIGESIITLEPSSGFCAELATATTVLLASRLGLPVSTSHALVGGVVGVGFIKNPQSIQLKTLKNIALAWIITIPVSAALSVVIFSVLRGWGIGKF